jgi:hypothetical protein
MRSYATVVPGHNPAELAVSGEYRLANALQNATCFKKMEGIGWDSGL